MTSKKFFIILTTILAIAFSAFAQPAITWSPSEIGFGEVPIRTTDTALIMFENRNGTEPLEVTAHAVGEGFNVPTDEMITLPPGKLTR